MLNYTTRERGRIKKDYRSSRVGQKLDKNWVGTVLLNISIKYSFSLKRDTCCLQTEQNRTQAVYNRETNDLQMADTVIGGGMGLMRIDTERKICHEFLFIRQSNKFIFVILDFVRDENHEFLTSQLNQIDSIFPFYRKRNRNFRN